MNRFVTFTLAVLAAAALSACQTAGTGTASSLAGDVTATLSWQSTGARHGTMTAVLDSGASYSGPYFQITRETQVTEVHPLWDGWGPRWRRWDPWGPGDWSRFVTEYTGRVVANLAGVDGAHMRCRFHLVHPQQGMAGGGQGECQLPDGRTIDAVFPQQQS